MTYTFAVRSFLADQLCFSELHRLAVDLRSVDRLLEDDEDGTTVLFFGLEKVKTETPFEEVLPHWERAHSLVSLLSR